MRTRGIRTEIRSGLTGIEGVTLSRQALDQMFSVTYEELRRLASTVKRNDPSATFTPTALVNEAWLKLAKSPRFVTTSPLHFKRIAARAMRQVLVEAARRRGSSKRGGDGAVDSPWSAMRRRKRRWAAKRLLALEEALEELERAGAAPGDCWWKAGFTEGWTLPRQRPCWMYRKPPCTGSGKWPRLGCNHRLREAR